MVRKDVKFIVVSAFIIAGLASGIIFLVDTYLINRLAIFNQSNYTKNVYSKSSTQLFATTQDFIVSNADEALDILFTGINNRWDKVRFFCDRGYEKCLKDFQGKTRDKELMIALNDYIHPFYQYRSFSYESNPLGFVIINIDYIYKEKEIEIIENKIKDLNLNSIEEVNKYVVENIHYQEGKNSIFDILENKEGNCKAITEFVNVALSLLGVPSYTISNEIHAWNIVFIEGDPFYLDCTWNILSNNKYYLITPERWKEFNEIGHEYPEIYNLLQ